jgi:serine protease Do
MASVTDAWADSVGAKQGEGAIVAAVTPDSPALRAGLQEGDIIVRFDGKAVSGIHELPQLIRGTKVGKTVAIEVWRDNRLVTLQAKVGQTEDGTQQTRSRRHRN